MSSTNSSSTKPASDTLEHVHGPDCQHDHDHGHEHGHHHEPQVPYQRAAPKLGRNDPCSCGSGKKFKKCHGADNGAAS